MDVDGTEDEEILNFGDQVKVFADWHPDGEHIVFLSESTGDGTQDHFSLGVYHWPTHSLRWLIDDPERVIEGEWVTRDGLVVVDEMKDANHLTTCLDITTGQETPFPRLPGNLLPIGQAVDGTWIAMYYSATSPAELVRLPLKRKVSGRLGLTDQGLGAYRFIPQRASPGRGFPLEISGWNGDPGLVIPGITQLKTCHHLYPWWTHLSHRKPAQSPNSILCSPWFQRAGCKLSWQHRVWP